MGEGVWLWDWSSIDTHPPPLFPPLPPQCKGTRYSPCFGISWQILLSYLQAFAHLTDCVVNQASWYRYLGCLGGFHHGRDRGQGCRHDGRLWRESRCVLRHRRRWNLADESNTRKVAASSLTESWLIVVWYLLLVSISSMDQTRLNTPSMKTP